MAAPVSTACLTYKDRHLKVAIDELSALPQQRLTVNFKEEIPLEEVVKPVLGELSVMLGAAGVRVRGSVSTLLKLTCHTCLRPFFQSLTVNIDERFAPEAKIQGEVPRDRELLKEDFVEPLPEDGLLDITDVVYQAVTLAAPVYCRCGADCPGPPKPETQASQALVESSPQTGQQKPVDPRWKNLKSLFPKDESSPNS